MQRGKGIPVRAYSLQRGIVRGHMEAWETEVDGPGRETMRGAWEEGEGKARQGIEFRLQSLNGEPIVRFSPMGWHDYFCL